MKMHVDGHTYCDVAEEHGREWAVCPQCGAQWAVSNADLELVKDGDGYCEYGLQLTDPENGPP